MKKTNYILTAVLCLALTGLTGCSAPNTEEDSESSSVIQLLKDAARKLPGSAGDMAELLFAEDTKAAAKEPEQAADDTAAEPAVTESAENDSIKEDSSVINNGGSVVRIHGNDYFWKYTSESIASDGVFARYSFQPDSVNDMVCRHPDGTEETIFSAAGNGSIYIAGDRMYLASSGKMFSVKLDGSSPIDYDLFTIWDSIPEAGLVIGSSAAVPGVQIISSESGSMETLAGSENTFPSYAGTLGNFLYYSAADPDSQEPILWQYALDGSGTLREIDRFSIAEDRFSDYGENVSITQTAMLDNCLYYSYGFYAGTGGFFQSGGINCVELDEDGAPSRHSVCTESISAEEFVVEKRDGDIFLYYITETPGSYIGFWDDYPYDGCTVKNLSSGETKPSSFRLSRPGSFVLLDGAVCTLEENQAAYKTLLSQELVSSLGCLENQKGTEENLTIIRDLEVVDQDIFYTAETSQHDSTLDIGWRPGYRRTESRRFLQKSGQEQPQLLFAY